MGSSQRSHGAARGRAGQRQAAGTCVHKRVVAQITALLYLHSSRLPQG